MPSTTAILGRYFLYLVGLMIAIGVVSYLLQTFFNIGVGSGASIAGVLVAAMLVGQFLARSTGRVPEKATMWRLSFYFVLINFAISGLFLALIIVASETASAFNSLSVGLWLGIALFVGLIIFFASRFALSIGANQELKRQQKLANKTFE